MKTDPLWARYLIKSMFLRFRLVVKVMNESFSQIIEKIIRVSKSLENFERIINAT